MKIAQGIITLTITFFLGIASMGSIVGSFFMRNVSTIQTANSELGVAIILLIGAAFSFEIPLVSFITFAVATIWSFISNATSQPDNLNGFVFIFSFAFSLFSLATWLMDRRRKKRLSKSVSE